MKANEAKELVAMEIKRKLEAKIKAHNEWLENIVSVEIEKVAKNGKSYMSIVKPLGLDSMLIANILEENGYFVEFNNGYVKIKW